MRKSDWRDALNVDFSEGSGLKARLLAELMKRTDAPIDDKEDMPMKTTIKHSARVLIAAMIAVLLLSGVALAMMKSLKLGPFATYTQSDGTATRQEIDEFVNGNRAVWEGKLFFADGSPVEDLAAYMWTAAIGDHPYELYNADGVLAGLGAKNDEMVLISRDEVYDDADGIPEMHFDTFDAVKPHLNAALVPALPAYLPEGYALAYYSAYTDENDVPYPDSKYLTVVFKNGDKAFEADLRLMDEETAFEQSSSEPMTELTINGHSAVADGRNLSILIGDILYEFFPSNSGLTLDELIKIAESI